MCVESFVVWSFIIRYSVVCGRQCGVEDEEWWWECHYCLFVDMQCGATLAKHDQKVCVQPQGIKSLKSTSFPPISLYNNYLLCIRIDVYIL
jgi:hypothetical protein